MPGCAPTVTEIKPDPEAMTRPGLYVAASGYAYLGDRVTVGSSKASYTLTGRNLKTGSTLTRQLTARSATLDSTLLPDLATESESIMRYLLTVEDAGGSASTTVSIVQDLKALMPAWTYPVGPLDATPATGSLLDPVAAQLSASDLAARIRDDWGHYLDLRLTAGDNSAATSSYEITGAFSKFVVPAAWSASGTVEIYTPSRVVFTLEALPGTSRQSAFNTKVVRGTHAYR